MSNMVVNTNVLALNSHRSLKSVGNMQSKSSARLSSGQRINSAADDAAGLAISEKMRSQVRGLDMASKNSQDAISLIQTAEGGMQEIDNMLQRVRELTVQAANDTNDLDSGDRTKIQEEVNQLVEEIDSMSTRTEFNKKKVISGEFGTGLTAKGTSGASGAGPIQGADLKALQKSVVDALAAFKDTDEYRTIQDLAVNGSTVAGTWETKVATAMTAVETAANATIDPATAATLLTEFAKLTDLFDSSNTDYTNNGVNSNMMDAISGTREYSALSDAVAELAISQPVLMPKGGVAGDFSIQLADLHAENGMAALKNAVTKSSAQGVASQEILDAISEYAISGTGMDNILEKVNELLNAPLTGGANDMVQADKDDIRALFVDGGVIADLIATKEATSESSSSSNKLFFQVGANSNQKLELNIEAINSKTLGIGNGKGKTNIDLEKASGSDITGVLDKLDNALSFVTTERSKLGAAQNRLEYTIKSLDISSENLTAAESRIRDTDMAKEMMNLTKSNVLQQAATSMLTQANQAPQNILQLLR